MHVDVNIGGPISPKPQQINLPRLLDGALKVRGYPLEMVLAEKIGAATARGSANARWRDFVDIYSLVRRHTIKATTLGSSLERVAQHRCIDLVSLEFIFMAFEENFPMSDDPRLMRSIDTI